MTSSHYTSFAPRHNKTVENLFWRRLTAWRNPLHELGSKGLHDGDCLGYDRGIGLACADEICCYSSFSKAIYIEP